ncbi:hypothetical protein HMPREF9080_00172 [Cardiobacterium valvarum F0432]|uniref:Uncharacterized protein n=1 Tax=Cardiobacterium valvarum F0432 TaxID=797473 RepID=G9ZBP8_9GAMM|nr:hypothetical protein HMPREF9080_00172 [Cardiobacterium valvarum F0432]
MPFDEARIYATWRAPHLCCLTDPVFTPLGQILSYPKGSAIKMPAEAGIFAIL